jgi:hypothetical protein
VHYYLQNLEIKKINDEKKAALAAQFAAEATLRRVHAAQKDDEMPPIEAIIAPLEAELKLARLEVYLELVEKIVNIRYGSESSIVKCCHEFLVSCSKMNADEGFCLCMIFDILGSKIAR